MKEREWEGNSMNIFIDECFAHYYQESPLVLIDIGARFGLQENWKPARSHLEVIAFEPDKEEFKRLRETETSGNTTYINSAVYNSKAYIDFHLTRSGGNSSILRPNRKFIDNFPEPERFDIIQTIRVETDTLDSLLQQNSIGEVDFLKVDSQGCEFPILEGARETLSERNLLGIEVEVLVAELYENQSHFLDVNMLLKSYDFELFDWRPCYWKRTTGKNYGGPKGQLIFADLLYLKSSHSIDDLLSCGDQGGNYKKCKVLKAISISALYGYFDRVLDMLSTNIDLFSNNEKDLLYGELKRQIRPRRRMPNFRGRYRLYKLANKISNILNPHIPHEWAESQINLGNVEDVE